MSSERAASAGFRVQLHIRGTVSAGRHWRKSATSDAKRDTHRAKPPRLRVGRTLQIVFGPTIRLSCARFEDSLIPDTVRLVGSSELRQRLQAYSRVPVHLVFSSSVLALGPGGGRGSYAGWKCLIEATIAEMAAQQGCARISVLSPGRLVGSRSLRRPASLMHSSYAHVARAMPELGNSSRARRTLLGLDARLWLLRQGLRSAAKAFASGLSG